MKRPPTKPKRWGKGYAMVPGWLLRKEPSPNAVVVYVHLAMHGTFNTGEGMYESCKPSKKTLANGDEKRGYPGCGLGEQVIGRALRELETLNAIKGEPAWDEKTGAQLPNVYRLVFGELDEEEEIAGQEGVSPVNPPAHETSSEEGQVPGEGITGDTPPGHQLDTPPRVSPVIHNLEPPTQNPLPRSVSVAVSGGKENPPRSDVDSLPRESEPNAGGDSETFSEKQKGVLNAAVEQAIAIRGPVDGWSQPAITKAMQTALDAGYPVERVASGIVDAACDVEGTHVPGRLSYLLKLAKPAPAPPAAEVPRKHLAPDVETCPRHRGEPRHGCNRCAAEVKGADVDAPSVTAAPMSITEARELARRNAARALTRVAS